jgi:hypothetical protein
MKLRYSIASLATLLLFAASCQEENIATQLDEVQVSTSYVAFAAEGSSVTVTVTATDNWTFANVPEWLTISPASGAAGETAVKFTAEAAKDSREAEVLLTCAEKTQRINVIQVTEKTETPLSTCAEIIAGPDSKTYRATGVCTKIANTQYGNWYLQDATGEIYIYGTVDGTGQYNWASFGIEVGDEVTVEGPKTTYNGTVELVDVAVIKVKKSLVKIEEGESASFDAAGGDFQVVVSVSGDGPAVKISDDATSWLGISAIEAAGKATTFKFHVAPNESEAARSATIYFTSTSGSSSSTVSASVSQMGLAGTLTNPFSVADAIAYCQTLKEATTNDFYVKGKVSRIADKGEFGSYGNSTFFISDDGEFLGEDDRNPNKEHDFEAYRVLYFNNEKWTEGHGQVSVGDEVLICGKLTLYNGISETSGNNAYLYSVNGVSTDENGLGSLAFPFNVAGAISAIDANVTANVFVAGVVSKIANNGEFGAQYGNGTFWISDDGVFNDDSTKDFEAYRVLWLGNRKWVEGDDQIAVGDKVVLCGALTKYGSTYETSSGKAYVYSVNGKTE